MIFGLLVLHLLIGMGVVAVGDRLGRRGFLIAAAAPIVTLFWLAAQLPDVLDGDVVEQRLVWVPELGLNFDFRLDAFGAVMVLIVSGIGVLVCGYAHEYFSHPKSGVGRLAGVVTLFAGAMLGVVLTDHLMALFVFWELTSITSYLLIGNDDRNPRARDAALSAILITGLGGLVMLAGFVLIGQAAGTYRISELAAAPPTGTTVTVGVMLALVGAFTKSAQTPFSSWLPGAMVAPTPISTYLHAATMVKAGVYLIARLAPIFALVGPWRWTVVVVGATTMVIGGWRALRQHDLKLLLAYGTISQLGFLVMLFGFGAYDLAQAGVVLLLAHGAFKAALFMVVGIIDHQAGTRDVRRLGRFSRAWWPTIAVGCVAAASMAGIPPMLGFIAKEKALDGALHADGSGSALLLVGIVVGSVLTVAYSGRYVLGLLGRLAHADRDDAAAVAVPPSPTFLAPAAVLAGLSLLAGLLPVIVDRLVEAATIVLYPDSHPHAVVLWAGANTALAMSAGIIAVGLLLVAGQRVVSASQRAFAAVIDGVPSQERVFWASLGGVLDGAKRTTSFVQNGSLPIYLMVILGVAAFAPLIPALVSVDGLPELNDAPMHVPIFGLIIAGAIGATIVRRRIAAALMLGATGYGMAAFYVSQGAPDLALTQFAIETLATVLFVLVLRFLPRRFSDRQRAVIARPVRLGVATLVGVSAFVFAIAASGARDDVAEPPISQEMLARSVPDGKGSNVVNVILVDFRGMDTLGEITVLVVAGLGAVALARASRRGDSAPDDDRAASGDASGDTSGDDASDHSDLPILAPGDGTRFARLPVLDASSRLLFASIMTLSVYFLFAGHNQPGGGFVGGLTAGAAISLRYVAGGATAVRDTFRFRPWVILGSGLGLSTITAIIPLLTGNAVLEHALFEWDLPIIGTIKATSALPFDIGVYLVVIGLVLMAYEAFGDDIIEPDAETERGPDTGSDALPDGARSDDRTPGAAIAPGEAREVDA